MINIIFNNISNTTFLLNNNQVAGGAMWVTPLLPILYSASAFIPPGNPWLMPAGRTCSATIPMGGSVNLDYLVAAGPIPQPILSITVNTPGGPPPPAPPPAPIVNWMIAPVVANAPMIATAVMALPNGDFDIQITIS